eukprot:PhF_6_TR10965/c2_g1_i3/m.17689
MEKLQMEDRTLHARRTHVGRIKDVSHLSGCRGLRKLDISGYVLRGLRGLEVIPTLETLDLHATNISDVSFLSGCRALRNLDVSHCDKLSDAGIVGLERIQTLDELNIARTSITDASALRGRCVRVPQLDSYQAMWY